MITMLYAYHAYPINARHGDGGVDSPVRGEVAEGIVAVDLCDNRGGLVECWFSGRVEDAGADARYVGWEAVDAVGVDAAEIGGDEVFGYDGCVGGGDAVCGKNAFCVGLGV